MLHWQAIWLPQKSAHLLIPKDKREPDFTSLLHTELCIREPMNLTKFLRKILPPLISRDRHRKTNTLIFAECTCHRKASTHTWLYFSVPYCLFRNCDNLRFRSLSARHNGAPVWLKEQVQIQTVFTGDKASGGLSTQGCMGSQVLPESRTSGPKWAGNVGFCAF